MGGGAPSAPPRGKPAPPPKTAAPPAEIPTPDRIDDEDAEKDKISTRKKKALEIKKVKEGVKTLGAIDPAAETIQDAGIAPTSGINTPT